MCASVPSIHIKQSSTHSCELFRVYKERAKPGTKSLKLVDPDALMARALPTPAKCLMCKSVEGELRACSFCKSGIYHDTAECLGEERGSEASLTYKSFPWCCPKCFKKGKAALEKMLLAPSQPKRKR